MTNKAVAEREITAESDIVRGGILVVRFAIGFLTMSLIRTSGITAGILPQDITSSGTLQMGASVLKAFDAIAKFAILTALAGVGLGTRLDVVLKIGLKPFTLGLCVSVVLSIASLGLILLFGMG